MKNFPSLKNNFLIAMPNLLDPNFYHAVTYIIEHDEEGAMGITINHPLDIVFKDLFTHLDIETTSGKEWDKKVLSGGPVQTDRGFILHTPSGEWEASMKLNNDIAVTTSQDILKALSVNEGPSEVEIILGYSGWGAGQLDQEIVENAWLSVPACAEVIFRTPIKDRWKAAAKVIGIDIASLSLDSGHG